MGDWDLKIVLIGSYADYKDVERIVSGYLRDGWEWLAVTQAAGSGERVWLRRRAAGSDG